MFAELSVLGIGILYSPINTVTSADAIQARVYGLSCTLKFIAECSSILFLLIVDLYVAAIAA